MANPILPGYYYADPFVYQHQDHFYMVATSDSPKAWSGALDCAFTISHSPNLTDWSEPEPIIYPEDIPWAEGKYWAPALIHYQGYWYLFYSADQQIGVAVCDTPTGRYRDILKKPLVPTRHLGAQAIDPSAFVDDDGKVYFLWGQGRGYLCEIFLSPTDVHFIGEPICISEQFYTQRSLYAANVDSSVFNEGMDLTKVNDKYLLTWSVYDFRDYRYNIRYAWADQVTGPYIQPLTEGYDNLMIQRTPDIDATGHGNAIFYQGELYQFYHRFVSPRNGYHREIAMDKIERIGDRLTVIPTK